MGSVKKAAPPVSMELETPSSVDDAPQIIQEEGEEEEEDDGEIHCICGKDVDKGLMIQCEKCDVWQHGTCLGIKSDANLPENWFCDTCQSKLEENRPSFLFLEDERLSTMLDKDFLKIENFARKSPQEEIESLQTDIGRDLLEKYALLFGRNQTKPGTDKIYIKALSLLFTCSEEEIASLFSSIGDEIGSLLTLNNKRRPPTEVEIHTGWKTEITNVYPKAGAKRPPSCQDINCVCRPFQKGQYAPVSAKKEDGIFSLFAQANIHTSTFIIEFIGKVASSHTLREIERESSGFLFNHDNPFVVFCKEGEKEYCIDARKRGNIARFLRHSCSPNAFLRAEKVHGRTYVGLYATQEIEKGDLITIPFQFPGKNFKTSTPCCCVKDDCKMRKWFQHRGTQVVRRLTIAKSMISESVDFSLLQQPIRRRASRLLNDSKSASAAVPISTTRNRNSKTTKRKVSRASIKAKEQKKPSKGGSASGTGASTPLRKRSRKELGDSKKRPSKKRMKRNIIISAGYMDLCSTIKKLEEKVKEPLFVSSLLIGRQKYILLKHQQEQERERITLRETRWKKGVSPKKAFKDRLKIPHVIPPVLQPPSRVAMKKAVDIVKPSPTLCDVAIPVLADPVVITVPPQLEKEELITSTPPPSPPRLPHGEPALVYPPASIPPVRYPIPTVSTFPISPVSPKTIREPWRRPPLRYEEEPIFVEHPVQDKPEHVRIMNIPKSRSCWDVVEKKVPPPRDNRRNQNLLGRGRPPLEEHPLDRPNIDYMPMDIDIEPSPVMKEEAPPPVMYRPNTMNPERMNRSSHHGGQFPTPPQQDLGGYGMRNPLYHSSGSNWGPPRTNGRQPNHNNRWGDNNNNNNNNSNNNNNNNNNNYRRPWNGSGAELPSGKYPPNRR